jgi:hypothetical protein
LTSSKLLHKKQKCSSNVPLIFSCSHPLPDLLLSLLAGSCLEASTMSAPSSQSSSKDGAVVVQTENLADGSKPSKLGSLSTMTRNSEGYGTHNRGKKQLLIKAERKMAPRFLLGVFLTIFM